MLKVGFIFLMSLAALVSGNDKGNGFGDQYEWYDNLSEGLAMSKSSGKPALVIIHQSWCPRCQELKPVFAGSQDIRALSDQFVFINCEDDDEPEDPEYAPDGSYYQRVLFVSPSKGVLKQIYCEGGSPEYRHWYTESDQIVKSMKKVLRASRHRKK